MNNIFIKFVETIKEPVKIFSVNPNKKNLDYIFDFKYWSEDIVSSDEEPNLYDNFVYHNHIINVFDENEYSDDIVYKYKKQYQTVNLKISDNIYETKKNIDLVLNDTTILKCKLCRLYLNDLMDYKTFYNQYNKYLIVNTIKYNSLKGIYNCGCELYCSKNNVCNLII